MVCVIAGVEESVAKEVTAALDKCDCKFISTSDEFFSQMDSFTPENVQIICCGPMVDGVPALELGQCFKTQVPGRPLVFCATENHPADKALLAKNGFDQSFFLPFDLERMRRGIRRIQSEMMGSQAQDKVSVPLAGLKAGTVLDFDVMVYLPLNQRYVRLFKKGGTVRPEAVEKLVQQGLRVVFVNAGEEKNYKSYVRTTGSSAAESLVARRERLMDNTVSLFQTLMGPNSGHFETGKKILAEANTMIGEIVSNGKTADLLEGLFGPAGYLQGDHYDQSLRISAYAATFSVLLGIGKPEDLALAGLFHHLGLSRCPIAILEKKIEDLTPGEFTIYSHHPESSVKILQEKKLIVVPEVHNAIIGHHERPDGKGFPKKLTAAKIDQGSSVLALAGAFDELTSVKAGRARKDPREALRDLPGMNLCTNDLTMNLLRKISV